MPIDPDFETKLKVTSEHNGHKVYDYQSETHLGIHGTVAAVDFDLCNADGVCIDVCPTNVFEFVDTPGHPKGDKKTDPIREADCVLCKACEVQCPEQAIAIKVD
jgi:NAD-dependent dihydropyrimidine dehydrogenase PreA subunit